MGNSSDEPMARHVISIGNNNIHAATWGAGVPTIFLLHEGLGSVAGWKGVPAAVAAATGETILAYDRAGHGASTPTPIGAWPTLWLHHEASVLGELADKLGSKQPLLVGHSDGGSIALIATAEGLCAPRGVLTLAAHSWVEQICHDSIVAMRSSRAAFVERLARTHVAPANIFEAWSGVWVSDDFQRWDIRNQLSSIACPTLIAQGGNDEYASQEHAAITAAAIGANASSQLLPGLGHLLHHQDADAVVDVITSFASASAAEDPH